MPPPGTHDWLYGGPPQDDQHYDRVLALRRSIPPMPLIAHALAEMIGTFWLVVRFTNILTNVICIMFCFI